MEETLSATRTCPAPTWWKAAPTVGNTATFSLPIHAEDLASKLEGIAGVQDDVEDHDLDDLEELLGITVDPKKRKFAEEDSDPQTLDAFIGSDETCITAATAPSQKRQKKEKDMDIGPLVETDIDETIAATTALLARGMDSLCARLQGIPVDKLSRSLASLRSEIRANFERKGVVY